MVPGVLLGQWTNRYPKNAGYGHQVYLEGYDLPILARGIGDPAPSPDGSSVAFASRGWIWLLDLNSGVATRQTQTAGVDSRPAWSKDGKTIAFVRDDSRTTAVVLKNLSTGEEREIERGLALDPTFHPDGSLIYSGLTPGGDIDLYRFDPATGARTPLGSREGPDYRPQVSPDGARLFYLNKSRGGLDAIRVRGLAAEIRDSTITSGNIISQTRHSLSPNGAELVYNWPVTAATEVRLHSTQRPGQAIILVRTPRGRPITPAWSADGAWIYYSEADDNQTLRLWRVNKNGGKPTEIAVTRWAYGTKIGRLLVRTGGPARVSVRDANGHPLVPESGMVRFDGQNGTTYSYSEGSFVVEAPAGEVSITAVRGLASLPANARVDAVAGEIREASVVPETLWDAQAKGWFAGDHHFHLNYGGQFDLAPTTLIPALRGEGLDVGTPMLANLHTRFENQDQWPYRSLGSPPLISFAQEVRSHFLGHVGLIGTSELFWPWIWGPGYEVYGRDDRTNAEALEAGRKQGGLGVYVHPVPGPAPFTPQGMSQLPVELVADAALGMIDLLEIVCLWSSEIGTTELWYRFLNAGFPIAPSAGTDAMTDLYRTMALGSTRVYVRLDGPLSWASYLAALKAGRSFVTTGPMIDLRLGNAQPGDSIPGGREVTFNLDVHSAVPVDSISVVVNGKTVWSAPKDDALTAHRELSGRIRVPAGGWVAARVVGPAVTAWPAMASRVFGHTAPIWLGRRGSTDPGAQKAAVTELLSALENAETRLKMGYAGSPIPVLLGHFRRAKERLALLAR